MTNFNHLNIPDQWGQYFTKYPQGYTILEALLNWVQQVDDMVDNQNTLNTNVTSYNTKVDDFIKQFDPELQATVTKTLQDWQDSGFLDVVMSEALEAQVNDSLDKLETKDYYTYENGAVAVFIDDDGSAMITGDIKTVADQKGIKLSFATIAYYVENEGVDPFYATRAQLTQMKEAGHDIINHSYQSELHTLSEHDLDIELDKARTTMKKYGFPTDVIVYPTGFAADGTTDILVKKHVSKYFKYGINAWGGNTNPLDSYYIGREDFNHSTLDELKAKVDTAIENKTLIVFMVHCWQAEFDKVKLASLIDYIQSKPIPILPFSEAIKYKGNPFQYGEMTRQGFAIGSNGFVASNFRNCDVSEWGRSAFDYAQKGVTVENFPYWVNGMPVYPSLNAVGWARYGGYLVTFRGWNDSFTRQLFYQHNTLYPAIFSRSWNSDSKIWDTWQPLDRSNHIGTQNGADFENAAPNTYPVNSVTTVQVNNGSWSLLAGKGGTLINYRSQDDAYAYQDFTPYDEATKYKRTWNGGTNSWNAFTAY
jgi:hypothetical protein